MWKKFFAPEILFLMGTLQALLPYVLWSFNGLNRSYSYTTTYVPLVIWATGYFSFWIGTKFVKNIRPFENNFFEIINWNKFNVILAALIGLTCLFIAQAIIVYGGIPLVQYANEIASVNDINEIQTNSSAGQFGILASLLLFLNSFVLIIIVKSFESGKKYTFLFGLIIFIEIFGGLMAGKRQSLLITAVFVTCGLSLRYVNPFKPILDIINIPTAKFIRFFTVIAVASLIIWIIGAASAIRSGNSNSSGIDEIFRYLELPLINLESQCETIGFGFTQNNFMYPFISLLPFSMMQDAILSVKDLPRYPEPTSPAGFYGALHWGFGIYGTISASFIFGLISKYLYSRSSHNIFYFLTYCQISWTLIAAHTYNHFLTLLFIPVPTIVLLLFSKIINNSNDDFQHKKIL
jgi:oligosaccharide repeat unit polymerase